MNTYEDVTTSSDSTDRCFIINGELWVIEGKIYLTNRVTFLNSSPNEKKYEIGQDIILVHNQNIGIAIQEVIALRSGPQKWLLLEGVFSGSYDHFSQTVLISHLFALGCRLFDGKWIHTIITVDISDGFVTRLHEKYPGRTFMGEFHPKHHEDDDIFFIPSSHDDN